MIFVPMLHYLQNKNSFSGNEDGMRYLCLLYTSDAADE